MLISKSEFARRAGVSPVAVGKAVKSGRLTLVNGKLDEKVAALQWDANRQRPAPPPKGCGITRPAVIENAKPVVSWLMENSTLWLATMIFHPDDLHFVVEQWIIGATGSNDPRLIKRLFDLLLEIRECVERAKTPELMEESEP